jgi:hypothetical protein
MLMFEAGTGIEPVRRGFADRSVSTSPPGQNESETNNDDKQTIDPEMFIPETYYIAYLSLHKTLVLVTQYFLCRKAKNISCSFSWLK